MSAYAQNLSELAAALGIDRKTLHTARKAWAESAPPPRPDGRFHVGEYAEWVEANKVGEGRGTDGDLADKRTLECELLTVKIARERVALGHDEEHVLLCTEVESGVGQMLQGLRVAIDNVTPRLARKALGLTDYSDLAEIIDGEMDVLKRTIRKCEFFDSEGVELSADRERDAPKKKAAKRAKKKAGKQKAKK